MIILITIMMMYIWRNSSMSVSDSHAMSRAVSDTVNNAIETVTGNENPKVVLSEHFVRKVAHVLEYSVLGLLVTSEFKSDTLRGSIYAFITGVLIASLDETIQIFSGRGPGVRDVAIDMCGYTTLMFAATFIQRVRKIKLLRKLQGS